MSFYFSLWFSAFLSTGYWEWREQLVFQSLRYSWEKPWSFPWWLPKIIGWKPDGKNENAIQPSAPFLHNFHIKSTWSINCVQHKIALGAEEKMTSPAHSISHGDVGSELPKKSSLANLLGTRASPQKTEQAAVHAQIARRAKHIVTLLERKSTQEVHWQQEPASGYGANTQETSALTVGGSREMATPWGCWGREREAHIRMLTHAHMVPLKAPGSRGAVRQPDDLPGSELHLLHPLNYLLSPLRLRHKHIYSFRYTCWVLRFTLSKLILD